MEENTIKTDKGMKKGFFKTLTKSIGLPTLIIAAFFLLVMITAAILKQSLPILISDILRRFGMNGLLFYYGSGKKLGQYPNFALPLGSFAFISPTIGIEAVL